MTTSSAMFYRSPSAMSPPSKNKLKRQSRIFSQVLYRTLSYKDRSSVAAYPVESREDPSELSTQVSAPGVLKIFGCHICAGAHYKSVLATASSSAQELVKEALERYGLSKVVAGHYVLCDVIGTFGGLDRQWQMEGLRVLRDNEKPLLIQDLWKAREGFSRRFELRKRSEVEELASKDKDTITAGINAQARKLQRNRTKGTMTLLTGCKSHPTPPQLRRTVSETSLSQAGALGEGEEEPFKRHYSTLPETLQCLGNTRDGQPIPAEEQNGSHMRYSLYQSPHLLLLQGYSQQHDPASLSRFTIKDLLPDLQHILFWMSNSIEILYFVQQKSPVYIQSMEEELDIKGSKESLFSLTITASEEAMTVLEEVIMYTFQQCVYYISKSLYVSLPTLLECNPFQSDGRDSWLTSPPLPEEVRKVVLIYQATLDLLHQYEVHLEIASQMFAYLFFFTNTLLFNQLMEKGCSLGCFHWSKGVRVRATLRLLLEWAQSMGFGQLAHEFFSKLSSVASLLAMPNSQLVQMTWPVLRAEFPALNPAQLHHILTQYQASSDVGCVPVWQPSKEDSLAAFRTEDVLESFDSHPPIMLPSGGFKVDLEAEHLDDNVYQHLLYIRHFLWSLHSRSPHPSDSPNAEPPKTEAIGCQTSPQVDSETTSALPTTASAYGWLNRRPPVSCVEPRIDVGLSPVEGTNSSAQNYDACELQLHETLQQLHLQELQEKNGTKPVVVPADPSCLLTPPNTPLTFDPTGLELTPEATPGKAMADPRRNGFNGTKTTTPEGSSPTPCDFPTPASSSRSSATDDFCYVFVVELEKGPIGLGMGLIDGMHTPLNSSGIYIRTLIHDSPAAADGRLAIGDRILAVNGTSLIGSDYQSAVDLIRSGGKQVRFLVAKSDLEIAKRMSSSASPSP
ncbi:ras-associating and dilute domain-containing protein isoform X4 [Rhineura floridana]|uniref:ras-associating and dilute domain-containing protein isoform X4 n=1 Tax=Rhineura floridana TaxID=261503 RepID=UPI002AC7F4AC|nr:ras-associating and dilute domain-containing protein isoform X4 [Rhineura floridana]